MRCPICRADNDCGPNCRRCRADLSLLFALKDQRDRLLAAAPACLAQGRIEESLRWAARAEALRRGEETRHLQAAGHLLRRDFAAAWSCYQEKLATDERG